MTPAHFWVTNVRFTALKVTCRSGLLLFSAALLKPVRVVRVAQVAPYAVWIAVDAALPIALLDLLPSFEQLSILTTGAPFKVLTCVRVASCGKCLSILAIRHT